MRGRQNKQPLELAPREPKPPGWIGHTDAARAAGKRGRPARGELGISNGRAEAINNKFKVTVRMGYDFRNTDNLVALLMLRCGD